MEIDLDVQEQTESVHAQLQKQTCMWQHKVFIT